MRDMFDNMYTVRIANSGDVAGFPKSHDGLEKAIILASREGTDVTFDGEVVWSSKDWFFVMREMKTYKFKSTDMTPENLQIIEDGHEFYYDPEMEHEDDVSKIWHDIHCAVSTKRVFHLDWSPYSYPSSIELEMWFALGCPNRYTINDGKSVGGLTRKRLLEAMGRDLCIAGYGEN